MAGLAGPTPTALMILGQLGKKVSQKNPALLASILIIAKKH